MRQLEIYMLYQPAQIQGVFQRACVWQVTLKRRLDQLYNADMTASRDITLCYILSQYAVFFKSYYNTAYNKRADYKS